MVNNRNAIIAYFSMEVGLVSSMPTYSGGLGVLAGDTLRAAADAGVPMIGVTLLHRKGYFVQEVDGNGWQREEPVSWDPASFMQMMQPRAAIEIEGRRVLVAAWRYVIRGVHGHTVPVYFLDTDLPENDPRDRVLTDQLYGNGPHYRICQEVVLGIGGVEMLRVLRHDFVRGYHMNEGHAAFLTLSVLEAETHGKGLHATNALDVEAVRDRCIFTTHTPVPAGHDQFPVSLVEQVLGHERASSPAIMDNCANGVLNMTYL
ncbi:MAG: alpha-glucan family phosphorylase, partial [Dehalococcoidia bacterium]